MHWLAEQWRKFRKSQSNLYKRTARTRTVQRLHSQSAMVRTARCATGRECRLPATRPKSHWVLADGHISGLATPETALAIYWDEEDVLALPSIAPGRYWMTANVGESQPSHPADPTLAQIQHIVQRRGSGQRGVKDPVWWSGFRFNQRAGSGAGGPLHGQPHVGGVGRLFPQCAERTGRASARRTGGEPVIHGWSTRPNCWNRRKDCHATRVTSGWCGPTAV